MQEDVSGSEDRIVKIVLPYTIESLSFSLYP